MRDAIIGAAAAMILSVGLTGIPGSIAAAGAVAAPDATALPGGFKAPFKCGTRWTYSSGLTHNPPNALDFNLPHGAEDRGKPVLATADGTAHLVNSTRSGLVVNIDHGGGWKTRNFHLSTRTVTDGERVKQGQQIGTIGDTGTQATAPHLHYSQELNGVVKLIQFDGKSLAPYPTTPDKKFIVSTNGCDSPVPPAKKKTKLTYSGPTSLTNGAAAKLSAKLTDANGKAIAKKTVSFALGTSGNQQTCKGDTDTGGVATCTIDAVNQTPGADGSVPLTAKFAGDSGFVASQTSAKVLVKRKTKLTYSGARSVSNGSPAQLSAELTDDSGKAVAQRMVHFTLGTGDDEQTCEGTTDTSGNANCTIESVNQPLTEETTIPATARFDGDDAFEPSQVSADVRLQFVSGRSFGLSANVPLPLLPISVKPTPDTGEVRTAGTQTVAPPCGQSINALLLSARVLCAKMTAETGPARATATASLDEVNIGLLGLPVVGLSGVHATSTSTCTAQSGNVDLSLTVAGIPVKIDDVPNFNVNLGVPGTKLVVNEQIKDGQGGLTVNAIHLTAPGGIDIVAASSTTAAHNCT